MTVVAVFLSVVLVLIASVDAVESDKPQYFQVLHTDDHNAWLDWELPIDIEPLLYRLHVRKRNGGGWVRVDVESTDTFAQAEGLEPLTDYVFRLRVKTARGLGSPTFASGTTLAPNTLRDDIAALSVKMEDIEAALSVKIVDIESAIADLGALVLRANTPAPTPSPTPGPPTPLPPTPFNTLYDVPTLVTGGFGDFCENEPRRFLVAGGPQEVHVNDDFVFSYPGVRNEIVFALFDFGGNPPSAEDCINVTASNFRGDFLSESPDIKFLFGFFSRVTCRGRSDLVEIVEPSTASVPSSVSYCWDGEGSLGDIVFIASVENADPTFRTINSPDLSCDLSVSFDWQ